MKTAILTVLLISSAVTYSQDWSQWRGPNRDGVLSTTAVPVVWPEKLQRIWQTEVGEGHSSPVFSKSKIFVMSRQGEEEVLWCLRPGDGETVWRKSYPAPYTMHPAAFGHGKGPKSTPVVYLDAIVTLGISGILSCYHTDSGKLNWQKTFSQEFPSPSPVYGAAMSPLIYEGLCLIHVGGNNNGAFIAVDVQTGAIKWKWSGDGPSYASPIIVSFDGVKQVVNFSQEHIIGLDFKTGELLWQEPFKTPWLVSCATPLVVEGDLILTGYNQGMLRFRVNQKDGVWSTEQVWKNSRFGNYMNTPVRFDNLIVTFADRNRGQYGILDAGTGKIYWRSQGRQGGNAALVRAGDMLLSLQTDSRLIVSKPSAQGLDIVREYTVADSPTWAHPLIFDKKMLIKDKTTLAMWSLE
ncbi:MAG: PQQ-binding-like beta-propeller repeat protein [bacterium]